MQRGIYRARNPTHDERGLEQAEALRERREMIRPDIGHIGNRPICNVCVPLTVLRPIMGYRHLGALHRFTDSLSGLRADVLPNGALRSSISRRIRLAPLAGSFAPCGIGTGGMRGCSLILPPVGYGHGGNLDFTFVETAREGRSL
jgi:hypothetical protein